MTLTALVAEPLVYRASASRLGEPEVKDVSGLIDTLSNRIGESQLYRLAPVESDIPERAIQRVTPLAPATGASWPPHWPRPSRLLDPPEHIETVALLPDHPPAAFTWRGLRRRVARADGPERMFGEWWKSETERNAVRDYFQVEDDAGERYWLFRAGDGEDAKDRLAALVSAWGIRMSGYVELQCASHFSFLRGVSSAEELFATAAMLGMEALAITDLNSLSGIVRAHEAARTTGVRLIVGCRLRLTGRQRTAGLSQGPPRLLPAMPASQCRQRAGWQGEVRSDLGGCGRMVGRAHCHFGARPAERRPAHTAQAPQNHLAGGCGYCALTLRRRPARRAASASDCAIWLAEFGVPPVVTNDVLFHEPGRRVLQNVVTCIREGCTIDDGRVSSWSAMPTVI